jgi:hypothetical protein
MLQQEFRLMRPLLHERRRTTNSWYEDHEIDTNINVSLVSISQSPVPIQAPHRSPGGPTWRVLLCAI